VARWGKVYYKQFEELQKQLEKYEKVAKKEFFEACAKELASRLLAKVIKRTPVGVYTGVVKFTTADGKQVEFHSKATDGIKGGTLRRGWTADSHRQAQASTAFGGDMGVKKFIQDVKITQSGDTYQIEIINPVEYASWVEFGHTTANRKGWVSGRFMLTISEQELDAQAPSILEKKLIKYLGECFNDQ